MSLTSQFLHTPSEKPGITLLAACSNTKTTAVQPNLRARALEERRLERRVEEWLSRLQNSAEPRHLARDLYGGDHWSTVINLADDLGSSRSVSLKVLSAGYGLVDERSAIKPYSATFSPDSPDLVAQSPASSHWWALINTARRLDSEPSTIEDLAAGNPMSAYVVIASHTYLQAIAVDLRRAADHLTSPTRLLIFSAGSSGIKDLERHLVRFDSRLRRLVGGSNISLNARVAAHVLKAADPEDLEVGAASAKLARTSAALEPIDLPARRPLTDKEVTDFIARDSSEFPGTSATASLRRLRDQGFACEQKRFHNLFRESLDVVG